MATELMTQLREALKLFCPTGAEVVAVADLAAYLGRETEGQRQVLSRRLATLIRRGEVRRVGTGQYTYVPGREPERYGESFVKMWRAIRGANRDTVFCAADIAGLTKLHSVTIYRYFQYLQEQRLIRREGKGAGKTVYFRVTDRGQEHRVTPYPPLDEPDRQYPVRMAAVEIVRLMMVPNIETKKVARQIQKQLVILNTFFSQLETETGADNGNE